MEEFVVVSGVVSFVVVVVVVCAVVVGCVELLSGHPISSDLSEHS